MSYVMGCNRHAIRKHKGHYAVVFHNPLWTDYLYEGTKTQCKKWLKEQMKLLKASR